MAMKSKFAELLANDGQQVERSVLGAIKLTEFKSILVAWNHARKAIATPGVFALMVAPTIIIDVCRFGPERGKGSRYIVCMRRGERKSDSTICSVSSDEYMDEQRYNRITYD